MEDPSSYRKWFLLHRDVYEAERLAVKSLQLRNCVDLGSGISPFSQEIGGEKIYVDLSLVALRELEGDKVHADVNYLPFRDKSLECTFTSVTICFLEDIEGFMREVERTVHGESALCIVTRDSEWGKLYKRMGEEGHEYYSHAHFISSDELIETVSNYFNITLVVSTLVERPGVKASPTILKGKGGSFLCVKGTPRTHTHPST